jgi:hypothetical protein
MAPNNSVNPQYPPRHSSFGYHSTTREGAGEGSRGVQYSQGVVVSQSLAPSANADGGETLVDFLAHAGGSRHQSRAHASPADTQQSRPSSSRFALPSRSSQRPDSSSSRSSDRKRRLTTAESPMRRPSSIRMHSNSAGSSTSDPILLDSSPAPALSRPLPPLPPYPQSSNAAPARRVSDIVLPAWQPDAQVSQCPVCGRGFNFLYRKHHCRKCGRVVCATCSPHRITIPRQFIVHPPSDGLTNVIDLTGDDDATMSSFGPYRNPALGGGEEVRVCNPCVPDPNYSLPPQYTPAAASRHPAPYPISRPSLPLIPPPPDRTHRSASSVYIAAASAGHMQTQQPRDAARDPRRVSYHGSTVSGERWLPPLPSSGHVQPSHSHIPTTARYTTPNNGQMPFNLGPGSQSVVNMFPRPVFNPATVPPPVIPTPRPRRQIAEEDECPICGNELPAKGPGNDEASRTQHIEGCIAMYSASPVTAPLTHTTSASLPTQRSRGMSTAGEASSSNRITHAARGMFPFIATEKDCVDADGNEEECVICFEEYEAGDKMARLVCWCKFHEVCSILFLFRI